MAQPILKGDNTMSKSKKKTADEIAIVWHIDDVKEVRPDLTDEQCRAVLRQADERHDATIGINWEVLEINADDLFPCA
jgi:hypothetical protein